MKKMRVVTITFLLLLSLAGCGNSASKGDSRQDLSNIDLTEFSEESKITEQSDEMESYAEKNDKMLNDRNGSEKLQSEQTEDNEMEAEK